MSKRKRSSWMLDDDDLGETIRVIEEEDDDDLAFEIRTIIDGQMRPARRGGWIPDEE